MGTRAVLKAIKLEDMVAMEGLEVTAATIVAVGVQTTDSTRGDTQTIISAQHSIETVQSIEEATYPLFLNALFLSGIVESAGFATLFTTGIVL